MAMTLGGLVSVSYTAMRGASGPVGTSGSQASRGAVVVASVGPPASLELKHCLGRGGDGAGRGCGRVRSLSEQPVEEGLHGGDEYSTATQGLKRVQRA